MENYIDLRKPNTITNPIQRMDNPYIKIMKDDYYKDINNNKNVL